MQRRSFVASVIGSTSLALSGCSGILEESEDEPESTEPGIPDPDPATHDQDGPPSLEADSTEEATTSESSQLKEEIVSSYDDGIRNHNSAMSDMNSAISAFNDDNYSRSESLAESAASGFNDAKQDFSEAYSLSLETKNQRAQQICSDAETYVTRFESAAETQIRAAQAAQNGNMGQANDEIDDFRRLSQRAEEVSVVTADTLENTF